MQRLAIAGLSLALAAARAVAADAPPNLEGVWGMVQHDRLGAPFFIPIEPKYTDEGKRITTEFMAKYDVKGNVTGEMEANGHCVEPGMPTVMWGIGGAAMEIVQQPQRITLLSELANQSRRIFLDGRPFPTDVPEQRVGYSIGHWEGDTLVIETRNIMEWHAPRWPHMYYSDFTPLDGPPPLAKTMGPQGTAEFLRKGAGLITQVEQRILKRVPELSF